MSYLQLSVTRADALSVETDITYDVERITIKRGLDQKANTTDLVLKNAYVSNQRHRWVSDEGLLIWEEDDTITIKAKWNENGTALSSSDILTICDALEFNGKLESGRTPLTVKAADKTFNYLNQQIAQAYTLAQELASPDIIKRISDFSTTDPKGTGDYQVTATLQNEVSYALQKASATPGIQTLRINNSDFPIVSIAKVYKPVYEWIEDLSSIEATNNFDGRDSLLPTDSETAPVQNRKMRYFVDRDARLRWFYPDDDIDYNIVIGSYTTSEDNLKSYNFNKSTFDVVNMVIYNGGEDLYGTGTLNYWFDIETKSRKLLSKYKSYVNVAPVLIRNEINKGNLIANTSGSFTFQGNRYNANTYGFNTTWGINTTGFSDNDYNNAVRAQIDKECKRQASAFTSGRGNPRWKGSITLTGANYLPGENIQITSYIHGLLEQQLRITDVTHTITQDSWTVNLSVEEDDAKIGV